MTGVARRSPTRPLLPGGLSTAREVPMLWLRDGGRYAFVAKNGQRCNERGFLEFHHVEPYRAGGLAAADNIELRCRAHNQYESDLFFKRRFALDVGQVPPIPDAQESDVRGAEVRAGSGQPSQEGCVCLERS